MVVGRNPSTDPRHCQLSASWGYGSVIHPDSRQGLAAYGQAEPEGGARPVAIVRYPKLSTMILNDRAAYGETYAKPAGFGAEKSVEQAIGDFRGNADAAVLHRDHDMAFFVL